MEWSHWFMPYIGWMIREERAPHLAVKHQLVFIFVFIDDTLSCQHGNLWWNWPRQSCQIYDLLFSVISRLHRTPINLNNHIILDTHQGHLINSASIISNCGKWISRYIHAPRRSWICCWWVPLLLILMPKANDLCVRLNGIICSTAMSNPALWFMSSVVYTPPPSFQGNVIPFRYKSSLWKHFFVQPMLWGCRNLEQISVRWKQDHNLACHITIEILQMIGCPEKGTPNWTLLPLQGYHKAPTPRIWNGLGRLEPLTKYLADVAKDRHMLEKAEFRWEWCTKANSIHVCS